VTLVVKRQRRRIKEPGRIVTGISQLKFPIKHKEKKCDWDKSLKRTRPGRGKKGMKAWRARRNEREVWRPARGREGRHLTFRNRELAKCFQDVAGGGVQIFWGIRSPSAENEQGDRRENCDGRGFSAQDGVAGDSN